MGVSIIPQQPLAPLTTLKVGGFALAYTKVENEADVHEALTYAHEHELAVSLLGGGSNILVKDEGFAGLVMHMQSKGMSHVAEEDGRVTLYAKAGELFDDVVSYSVAHGFWGLENLSHIPGTVGATPVQNVGAYGVEIKDVLKEVIVFDMHTRSLRTLSKGECLFSYRDSLFKHSEGKRFVIMEVVFELAVRGVPRIAYKDLQQYFAGTTGLPTQNDVRNAIIHIRSEKFPDWKTVGTAGSFFKNPIVTEETGSKLQERFPELPLFKTEDGNIKISLGYILDKIVGVRGYEEGNVRLFEKQALVLVAGANATAEEVISFAEKISKKVFEKTDIHIEMEVTQL